MSSPKQPHHLHAIAEKFRENVHHAHQALSAVAHPVEAYEAHQEKKELKQQLDQGVTMARQQVTSSPFGDPTSGVYQVEGATGTTTIEVAGIDWHGIKPGEFRGESAWDVAGAPLSLIGRRQDIEQWVEDNQRGYLLNSSLNLSIKDQGVTAQDHMYSDAEPPKVHIMVKGGRFAPLSKTGRFTVINPITSAIKLLAGRAAGVAVGSAMTGNVATQVGDYVDAVQNAKDAVSSGESGEIATDEPLYAVELTAAGGGTAVPCDRTEEGSSYRWFVRVADAAEAIRGQLG